VTENVYSSGVATFGGTTQIQDSVIGTGATGHFTQAPPQQVAAPEAGQSTDIGVITVLSEEAQAVRSALGLESDGASGLSFDLGNLKAGGRSASVVATRALARGEGSTMSAFNHLREHYNPRVIVLAGIAGGIHRDVRLGDVVVATRVVYYDLRKETPEGTRRRGQERQAPAEIGHAVNRFFTDHGEPAEFPAEGPGNITRSIRALTGPIGSGNAVIADRDSKILEYLAAFNDEILAVDMEAGGLSQSYHERSATSEWPQGWLVVRGISDHASKEKNDDHHQIASWHAAIVLRRLLPYLLIGTPARVAG
jgi:adenosylhomocysteine nucleosidase